MTTIKAFTKTGQTFLEMELRSPGRRRKGLDDHQDHRPVAGKRGRAQPRVPLGREPGQRSGANAGLGVMTDRRSSPRQFRKRLAGTRCIYCGEPTALEDHFPPHTFGTHGWLIPACRECNELAGTAYPTSFFRRVEHVKHKLRVRYRSVLSMPDWDEGRAGRSHARNSGDDPGDHGPPGHGQDSAGLAGAALLGAAPAGTASGKSVPNATQEHG